MRIALSLLLALVVASPAAAQERFKDVWVTQADSGDIVRGRIVNLSGETLSLLTTDNRRVEVPIERVLRIEAHGDSLKNGALIGAGVMAALTFAACANLTAGDCARIAPFEIGLGALIGTGIDALNGGRSTLYSRPAATASGKTARLQLRLRF
jgi:hypothetical protein